jgi:hypothetical protein
MSPGDLLAISIRRAKWASETPVTVVKRPIMPAKKMPEVPIITTLPIPIIETKPEQTFPRSWYFIKDNESEEEVPRIETVIKAAVQHFGIHRRHLISTQRQPEFVYPRHVAMYFAVSLTAYSYPQIGRAFGGLHHTTIISASRKIKRMIGTDVHIQADCEALLRIMADIK